MILTRRPDDGQGMKPNMKALAIVLELCEARNSYQMDSLGDPWLY
jgi:hypothetical protein